MEMASMGGGSGAIPASDSELQRLLADEKLRSDTHKNNYQKIKAQYTELNNEYVSLQEELKETIEISRNVQEKSLSQLELVRQELAVKTAEVEELKLQLPSEQSLQVLKAQIKEDLDASYKAKLQHLHDQVESLRMENNKMKYERTFLQSEYEHAAKIHAQVVNEMQLRHQAEVGNLRKEREAMIARYESSEENGDAQRVRVLQRNNAQLNLKVKGLLSELEELRAQREELGVQSDNVTRLQVKQLAEHQANIRTLETELSSARQQNKMVEQELSSVTSQHTTLTEKIHALQKENTILKNQAERIEHESRVEITNHKMEALKERGDIERQRDRLINENEELKSQIDVMKHSIEQQNTLLVDKERETVKQIQAAREDEWQKLHQVENEKLELETKIQELERRKIDIESERQAEKMKVEDRLNAMQAEKDAAEKETEMLKSRLLKQESSRESYERAMSENMDLKARYQRLETEYNSYISSEAELLEANQLLQRQLTTANSDVQRAREELHTVRQESERSVSDQRSTWTQEKLNLQRRLDELEVQIQNLQLKNNHLTMQNKKKKNYYGHMIDKLRDKITILHAKMEQLVLERDTLKKSIPPEAHILVKKKLNDLLRRHREFHSILTSVDDITRFDHSLALADLTHISGVDAKHSTPNLTLLDHDPDHLNIDLANLKERLNRLDDNQQQQLDELQSISKTIPPHPSMSATHDMLTTHHTLSGDDDEYDSCVRQATKSPRDTDKDQGREKDTCTASDDTSL